MSSNVATGARGAISYSEPTWITAPTSPARPSRRRATAPRPAATCVGARRR